MISMHKDLLLPSSPFVYFFPWFNQWSSTLKKDRISGECDRVNKHFEKWSAKYFRFQGCYWKKKQIKFENFIEWETLVIMFRAFKSISSNLVEFRVFGVFKSNLANFQDLLDLLVGNLRNSKKKFDKINSSKLNWSASAKKQKKRKWFSKKNLKSAPIKIKIY